MPWDYQKTAYRKQAAADEQWRLERLINYGLVGEKLDREELKKHLPHLNIPQNKRTFLELLLEPISKVPPSRVARDFLASARCAEGAVATALHRRRATTRGEEISATRMDTVNSGDSGVAPPRSIAGDTPSSLRSLDSSELTSIAAEGTFKMGSMGQTILTPAQQRVIAAVAAEPNLQSFYLSGGTALAAYHLFHRLSDDLDFFTFTEPDPVFLHDFTARLKEQLGATALRFERLYDRNLFFFSVGGEELKVEFTYYPFRQLDPPLLRDGIRVDSVRDLAANKLAAILDRFEPKDFVDLFFILRQRGLEAVRSDTGKKFHLHIESLFLGGELAKVRRIAALPRMLLPLTLEELTRFFTDRARALAPDILR